MNLDYLDFEQPIAELEAKIEELQLVGNDNELNIAEEVQKLGEKSRKLTQNIYSKLSSWQVVQVARHPLRPHAKDYIDTEAAVIAKGRGGNEHPFGASLRTTLIDQ